MFLCLNQSLLKVNSLPPILVHLLHVTVGEFSLVYLLWNLFHSSIPCNPFLFYPIDGLNCEFLTRYFNSYHFLSFPLSDSNGFAVKVLFPH